MYIPKSSYQKKETSHGEGTVKEVILDDSHLPGLLQFAKSYFKKGQLLELHFHESMNEVFILNYGKVRVTYSDEVFTANAGDSFYFKALAKHSLEFIEDTEMIYFCLEDTHV